MSQDITLFGTAAQLAAFADRVRLKQSSEFREFDDGSFAVVRGDGDRSISFNRRVPPCWMPSEDWEGRNAALASRLVHSQVLAPIYSDVQWTGEVLSLFDDPDSWVELESVGVVRADNLAAVVRKYPAWDWRRDPPPPGLNVVS